MTNQPPPKAPRSNETTASVSELIDGVLSQAKTTASDLLASDQAQHVTEIGQEWAAEATRFIKRNPWAAVLGAAAIGYYLGSTRNRGGGSR